MAQSTISYNVNGQSTPHPDVLEKHIRAINPRWLLIMDNIGMVRDYRHKFPNTNIVARNWALTKGDENVYANLTPAAWLDARLPEAGDGIYLYTGNEGGIQPQWHIELMKLVIARKLTQVRLVICNCAVGTPSNIAEWSQPVMKEFFQLLDEHRDQFVLGLHEYFCGIAPSGFIGGYPDGTWSDGRTNLHPNYENLANWPPDASTIGMLWHCGRFKVVNEAARSFGFNPPRILITEHGADDLSDVAAWAKKFPLPDGYTTHRGWKTNGPLWAKILTGMSPQSAFYLNVRYLNAAVYSYFSNVEGQLVFGWTSNSDWNQFDMSEAAEFMTLLEADVVGPETPAPALPAFPLDFAERAKSYMVRATDGATTVRAKPSQNSSFITTISPVPSIIKLIDAADLRPEEREQDTIGEHLGVWLPVLVGTSTKGWSFNGYLDVQPVTMPPVVVPDPPAPTRVTWQIAITSKYTGTVDEREASKEAWAGLADFIRHSSPVNQPAPEVTVSESD